MRHFLQWILNWMFGPPRYYVKADTAAEAIRVLPFRIGEKWPEGAPPVTGIRVSEVAGNVWEFDVSYGSDDWGGE